MTPADRHARITALFHEALGKPAEERAAWLERACEDDAIRSAVCSWLEAHETTDRFIDHPALLPAAADETDETENARVRGHRVGPWQIEDRIGEGGMGIVYRATRADGLYQRTVALKLIAPGAVLATGDRLARRLAAERQILARLEHDGIARLYDGGVTEDGLPYLALELVDGEPITSFSARHNLGTDERVRLFTLAVDAVAYAHRNLVVHRDLKPAHILVVEGEPGDEPAVKLLDFGISALLGDPGGESGGDGLTQLTVPRALTPSYAAPEQVRGEPVTTAADVYALGVVLYELLAEHRPYDLTGKTASEVERLVTEAEPPLPSAAAPPERARRLRGDLDTIVMKAMAKEPGRRYASASDLADDLRRHLGGLPVEARPATAGYRMGRFVRRHRLGVAAAAAVVLALVAGLAGTAWQARVARAEAANAAAVNEFLVGLLAAADPSGEEGRDVRVASLLDGAAATLDSVFADQPNVEATMRQTLGVTYLELGLFDEADRELRLGLALRERLYGARHPDVVETQDALGTVWLLQDDLEPADSLLTRALASARELRGEDELLGDVLSNLAYVRFLTGDLEASLAMHRASVAIEESQPDADPVEVASGLGNVAVVLENLGRADEAVPIQERQVAIYRRALDPNNSRIARALSNLSTTYHSLGRMDDALRANTEAVALFRRSVGNDSPELAGALSNLGPVLYALERYAESEAIQREAVDLFARTLGVEHPRYASALIKMGMAQERQGRGREAEAAIRRALGLLRANAPPDHPATANGLIALGELLTASGRPAEAEPMLREALTIRAGRLPPESPDRAQAASLLGATLGQLGRDAEAESLLVAGHAVLRRERGPDDGLTVDAAARLRAFQEATRLP